MPLKLDMRSEEQKDTALDWEYIQKWKRFTEYFGRHFHLQLLQELKIVVVKKLCFINILIFPYFIHFFLSSSLLLFLIFEFIINKKPYNLKH